MCDKVFSEAHSLGLCDFVDGLLTDAATGNLAPAHLKHRGKARIRETGPKVTQVDHWDGRVSATVRPDVIRSSVSISGRDR